MIRQNRDKLAGILEATAESLRAESAPISGAATLDCCLDFVKWAYDFEVARGVLKVDR